MDIRILGAHNCESQSSRLVSILVDGVLALDAGSLTSGLSFAAQQKLRAVLLTHQHYDHVRDIPALAFNLFLHGDSIDIYSIPAVIDVLTTHLLSGKIYSRLMETPQDNPTVRFIAIEPGEPQQIAGYSVLAVPVNHGSNPAVGYQISSPDGKILFYTGDTGSGLVDCWKRVSPQLLLIEVTASDKHKEFAERVGHLTPALLKQELISFREVKGYLPEVVLVHLTPQLEKEIKAEIASVAESLNSSISLAHEGMKIHL